MPRKRKTRAITNQTLRPKATLPEGDEGQDLKPEDRHNKLLIMIADFENEVKIRIENLESQKKNLHHRIRATYTVELMKIPKHIRGMKISEYLKIGGKVVNDESEDEDVEMRIVSVKEAMQRKPLSTVNEESDTSQKGRPPNGRRGRVAAANKSALMPPPSTAGIRKTRQRMFETPAQQQKRGLIPSRPGFETPLVTPKFDTRLPITPAIGRNPRPNEKIMSISGSPIYLNKNVNNRPKQSDILEVLQSSVNVDDIVHNIDDHTMHDLVQLQEKLTRFINAKK